MSIFQEGGEGGLCKVSCRINLSSDFIRQEVLSLFLPPYLFVFLFVCCCFLYVFAHSSVSYTRIGKNRFFDVFASW